MFNGFVFLLSVLGLRLFEETTLMNSSDQIANNSTSNQTNTSTNTTVSSTDGSRNVNLSNSRSQSSRGGLSESGVARFQFVSQLFLITHYAIHVGLIPALHGFNKYQHTVSQIVTQLRSVSHSINLFSHLFNHIHFMIL